MSKEIERKIKEIINNFNPDKLFNSSIDFFKSLNYPLDTIQEESNYSLDDFLDITGHSGETKLENYGIQNIEILFSLSEDEMSKKIDNFFEQYSILIKNDNGTSMYDEFINKNNDFNSKKIKLDTFYTRIFGNEAEDTKSLNNELEERLNRLKDIEKEAKKILSLSSDAGLAGGFNQKVDEVKKNKYVSLAVFVVVLIIMGIFNFNTIDFKNLKDIDLISIITRFMINIPFLWIATVANINLNKYTKLEQEYSHKESLAKSFERYKTEIEKLDRIDSEKSNSLMMNLMELNIEAFKVNPANSIDKIKKDSTLLDIFQRKNE